MVISIAVFLYGDRTFLQEPHLKKGAHHKKRIEEFIKNNGGYGQLTADGRKQMEDFGTALKEKYLGSMPNVAYDKNLIHVRTASHDRALLSAEYVLSKLFEDDRVPVHSVPYADETLFRGEDLCQKLNKTFPIGIKESFEMNGIAQHPFYMGDMIRVAEYHGFHNDLKYTLEEQKKIIRAQDEYLAARYSKERSGFGGGPMVSEIVRILEAEFEKLNNSQMILNNEKDKINENGDDGTDEIIWSNNQNINFDGTLPRPSKRLHDPKLVLYGANEETMMALMRLVHDQFLGFPKFGSSIVFEMNNYGCITLWYHDGPESFFTEESKIVKSDSPANNCLTAKGIRRLIGEESIFPDEQMWMVHCGLDIADQFDKVHVAALISVLAMCCFIFTRTGRSTTSHYRLHQHSRIMNEEGF